MSAEPPPSEEEEEEEGATVERTAADRGIERLCFVAWEDAVEVDGLGFGCKQPAAEQLTCIDESTSRRNIVCWRWGETARIKCCTFVQVKCGVLKTNL